MRNIVFTTTLSLLLPVAALAQQDINVASGGSFVTHPGAQVGIFGNAGNAQAGGIAHDGGGDVYISANNAAQSSYGTLAPDFYSAFFTNGTGSQVNITNADGTTISNMLSFSNGLTTTVRSSAAAGALKFRGGSGYTGSTANNIATPNDAQFVDGYVAKTGNTDFVYPTGQGNDSRPLEVSAGGSATDNIAIAYIAGDPGTALDPTGGAHPRTALATGLQSVSPVGFWDWVPVSGTAGRTITVSLPAGYGYNTPANVRLVGWSTTTGMWEVLGAGGASGTTEGSTLSGTVANIGNYSAIGIGSITQNPLPVVLEYFSGRCDNGKVALSWKSAVESGINSFIIERSADGAQWQKAATVAALGSPHSYQYNLDGTDQKFYRLRMVELGGSTSATASIRIACGDAVQTEALSLFPNPNTGIFNISFTATQSRNIYIRVINAEGRAVYSQETTAQKGSNTFPCQLQHLAGGVYYVVITDDAGTRNAVAFRKGG